MKSALFLAFVASAAATLAWSAPQPLERPAPGRIGVVRPPVEQPSAPPATALPTSGPIPAPQSYIAPGLEGIFGELRRAEATIGRRPALARTARPRPLRTYARYRSPNTPADPKYFAIGQIVVKFVEGSGVRQRGGTLQAVANDDRPRLSRFGLEPANVDADLASFARIVAGAGGKLGRAAPLVEEGDLDRLRQRGQARGGRELPDFNLFYFVYLDHPQPERALATLNAIRALRSVEAAYFQPIPFATADKPPITSIDVSGSQGYFGPAPTGIDATYARLFSGGRGNAVRIADIEAGWDDNHEDLPQLSFRFGVNWGPIDETNGSHGAAVLGELAADENGFGANGLVPNALVGWSSVSNFDPNNIYFYSVGSALLTTGAVLRPGDIALIEQQFNLNGGFICDPASDPCGDCTLPTWVAVEEYPGEHAAISLATSAGIVVVEAAGNGRMAVTPASTLDSGAIIVGAGMTNRAPFCWSNFGSRVDVQGWGGGIGTLGYGGFLGTTGIVAVPTQRANGADHDQWYTTSFGGTSGASPIVTAAAAVIQSTRAAVGLPKLTSVEMRALLASTGTPQATPVVRKIGPQPDLRAAMATYTADAASFVRQTAAPAAAILPGTVFSVSETFKNSGGSFWNGDHSLVAAPSFQSGVQQFQATPFVLGTAAAPIGPGDEFTHPFLVTAPVQPGTYSLGFLLRNAAGQTLASSPSQTVVVRASPTAPVDNATITIISAPTSLPDRGSGPVVVSVRNTGTTSWTPAGYSLRLSRFNRVSLPQASAPLPGPLAPGATAPPIVFNVICNGTGTGSFSVQMTGPGGPFGQSPGRTIVCR